MERRIYYFIFENEFMDDLISNLCEIFNISNKKNSNILSDDTEQVYILDAKQEGISCILANKDSYVYAVYIFTDEKYEKDIENMLVELAEEIEEEYDDDRRRFAKPIEANSELVKDCINTAYKFNFIDLLKQHVEVE